MAFDVLTEVAHNIPHTDKPKPAEDLNQVHVIAKVDQGYPRTKLSKNEVLLTRRVLLCAEGPRNLWGLPGQGWTC